MAAAARAALGARAPRTAGPVGPALPGSHRWHARRCDVHASNRSFVAPPSDWVIPQRNEDAAASPVITGAPEGRHTVYTVRLRTGSSRGAGMSEITSGVLIGIIGDGGRSHIHVIPQLYDERDRVRDLVEICSKVGEEGGADCRVPVLSLERTTADGSGKAPVRRFQQGALDEVSFVGLDVGAIRAVLLAPQSGTWEVDEVNVSSSRSPASHRFVCRKRLGRGRRADADAVQLLPVPADVVMYGDTPLSPAQARTVREGNLQQYQVRKATQTVANGALVAAGSVLCLLGGGPAYAGSFAAGGLGGILYFALLARQVESITSAPLRMAEEPPGAATGALSSLGRFTESAGFRYLVLFAMLYAFFWGLQNSVAVDEAEDGTHVVQVLLGVAGFLQYKVALLLATLLPDEVDERMKELVDDVNYEVREKLQGRK